MWKVNIPSRILWFYKIQYSELFKQCQFLSVCELRMCDFDARARAPVFAQSEFQPPCPPQVAPNVERDITVSCVAVLLPTLGEYICIRNGSRHMFRYCLTGFAKALPRPLLFRSSFNLFLSSSDPASNQFGSQFENVSRKIRKLIAHELPVRAEQPRPTSRVQLDGKHAWRCARFVLRKALKF